MSDLDEDEKFTGMQAAHDAAAAEYTNYGKDADQKAPEHEGFPERATIELHGDAEAPKVLVTELSETDPYVLAGKAVRASNGVFYRCDCDDDKCNNLTLPKSAVHLLSMTKDEVVHNFVQRAKSKKCYYAVQAKMEAI